MSASSRSAIPAARNQSALGLFGSGVALAPLLLVATLLGLFFPTFASAGFDEPQFFLEGFSSQAMAVGDFDDDNVPDLVVASWKAAQLRILAGTGKGSFVETGDIALPGTEDVAVADLNLDSKDDLVITQFLENTDEGFVHTFLGMGDGTFSKKQTFGVSASPGDISIAAINADKFPDVVVGNGGHTDEPANIEVLVSDGGGLLQSAKPIPVPVSAIDTYAADFDNDGKVDMAHVPFEYFGQPDPDSGTVYVRRGFGDGSFGSPLVLTPGEAATVTGGDVNEDGITDLIVASRESQVTVYIADGKGGFQPPRKLQARSSPWPPSIAVLDMNEDGHLDLTVSETLGNAAIYAGRGDGTFFAPEVSPLFTEDHGFVLSDSVVANLNVSDERPDVASVGIDSSGISVALQTEPQPPHPPTDLKVDPVSPGDSLTPKVSGQVTGGTWIKLFANPQCSGQPVAEGEADTFVAGGIPVAVKEGTQQTFHAVAVSGLTGSSSCSIDFVNYAHVKAVIPPPPPPPPPAEIDLGDCSRVGNTACFDGRRLHIRLKCPARFKPKCQIKSMPVTKRGLKKVVRGPKRGFTLKGRSMAVKPVRKVIRSNHWTKVTYLIKPKFRPLVTRMSRVDKKLLPVRLVIRSKRIGKDKNVRPRTIFHIYRVRN